jgi:membrane protease YdiL (CAAX protease family)
MSPYNPSLSDSEKEKPMSTIAFIKRYPVLTFYTLVFTISWGGILLLVGRGHIPGTAEEVERWFPSALIVMFAGPSIAGILMTGIVFGRAGLRELLSRLLRWRVGGRWYAAALLTGPLLVAVILFALAAFWSEFMPGVLTADDKIRLVVFGLAWGLIGGGLMEELGWTGFAVPTLRLRFGPLATGLIVGLLWGTWHLLIAVWASQAMAGGQSLVNFVCGFLAFYAIALPAYRVLMVWVYDRTGSLFVVMLMHAFLSASTLILQPRASAGHFTWNFILGVSLWIVVAVVAMANGWRLGERKFDQAG